MKVVAIIQARMASSRMPGKVLSDLQGRPLIYHIVDRVSLVEQIDETVVATTKLESDDLLVDALSSNDICSVYRGSENDVLERYYECARLFKADVVVRITADDPLKDPSLIAKAIEIITSDPGIDYCSNTIVPTYPEGLDIEVFRYSALERAYNESTLISEREHVTPYIWKNPGKFNIYNFEDVTDNSHIRLTVDYPEDLVLINAIYEHFKENPLVDYKEIIRWLNNNPDIQRINSHIKRNEGYAKTLLRDEN